MHIGILTFHAPHNFGSMLQNYALQQFLIAEGHSVETINLRNEKQKFMYSHPLCKGRRTPSVRSILRQFKDPYWLYTECKTWALFEKFLRKELILTKEYKNWDDIKNALPELKYDTIIVGGDQIWNTFCYDFDWSYYLPDNISPIKKIACSPSFGNVIPRTKKDTIRVANIKKCLENFDFLSIREQDGSDYLHELLNKDIPVIADPTILADPSIYCKLLNERIVKEPYIYYYTPSHIPDYEAEEIAIELAKQLNIKIVTSYPHFRRRNEMKSISTGPKEFLNLVNNAELVTGKSFHLVVFSILFHKKFVTIKSGKDARMSSLLNKVGISNRNIDTVEDFQHIQELDYRIADKELDILRTTSTTYLRSTLSSSNSEVISKRPID